MTLPQLCIPVAMAATVLIWTMFRGRERDPRILMFEEEAVELHSCPRCGAGQGDQCMTMGGNPLVHPHKERRVRKEKIQ